MNEKQLLEERARVRAEQVSITDTATSEARELTAEEAQKWDACDARLDELTKQIEIARKDAKRSEEYDVRSDDVETPEHREDKDPQAEYRAAFEKYVRRGRNMTPQDWDLLRNHLDAETRAQGVGTASAGGYLVPEGFQAEIIRVMKDFGAVMNVARVLTTESGNALPWPTVDDTSQVGALLAENTQIAEQDVTLGTKQLDAYKYTSKLVRVSWELLQDAAFDVEDLLRDLLGERVGRILNQHFTTGTGSSQPNGIATGASSGVTAASTTAITGDELIDLVHSVDRAYRYSPRARWMLPDTALKAVRKLKDGDSQYLWAPGLRGGEVDTLLGYPIEVNTDLATPAAGTKSVLFGDFYAGYVVRMVRGFQLVRLGERYADYLQDGFFGFARADGEVVNTSAYKAITMAAA